MAEAARPSASKRASPKRPPSGSAAGPSGPGTFLLYNERENAHEQIAGELRKRGVNLYHYQPDVVVGGVVVSVEEERLRAVRAVIVLLGAEGWGPTQRAIARQAISMRKRLIPVLIGDAPDAALDDLDGLFRVRRWVDLRNRLAAAYAQIVAALSQDPDAADTGVYDSKVYALLDGEDDRRSQVLREIVERRIADPAVLAADLRRMISGPVSPSQQKNYATAIRDPSKLPSARAWMLSALIWLDAESVESRELILRHLDPEHETERAARFWTLAGLVQRRVSYINDVLHLASGDPQREVAGLAQLVGSPFDTGLLAALRDALRSDTFETAWHVLRILRVFPSAALAGDVVEQIGRGPDGKGLAYDALFALASNEMTSAAQRILLDRFKASEFVDLVLREGRSSTEIAQRAFARVLKAFDGRAVEDALEDALRHDPTLGAVVERMRTELGQRSDEAQEAFGSFISGYASDKINVGDDALGINGDVERLAAVMIAREVVPPLAVGLFGDWGSGKSFYMRSIMAKATKFAKRARDENNAQFHHHVAPVEFNAWHYVDTNLWANLVSHILNKLAERFEKPEEKKAELMGQLATVKKEAVAAGAERAQAEQDLAAASKALEDSRFEREKNERKLRDLRAADILSVLRSDETIGRELRDALDKVGAPAAFESLEELNKVVAESYSTAGRALALFKSMTSYGNVKIAVLGLAALVAAPPLFAALLAHFDVELKDFGKTLGVLTAAIVSLVALLRNGLQLANSGLVALSEAKRKLDDEIVKRRAAPSREEQALRDKIAAAKAAEAAAAQRVEAANAAARALEDKLAAIGRSRSLDSFLTDRTGSEDYKRHLGLMSVIRKDFEELLLKLNTPPAEDAADKTKIDRIILFIDDVDRLPPPKVIEVLQAVHLLLTFELFVVVVCVDPRWLLHALKSNYSALAQTGGEAGVATPQDYLEKIFQIPFTVRPMGRTGFASLMAKVLAPSVERRPGGGDADSPSNPASTPAAPVARRDPHDGPSRPVPPEPTPTPSPARPDGPTTLESLARAITISAAETEFAASLQRLLPTPRSAKRFANVYRLLKSAVSAEEVGKFEGANGAPGEYRVAMLLLAALVGDAAGAAKLFPQFLAAARLSKRKWWREGGDKDTAELAHLRGAMDTIIARSGFPDTPEAARDWIPQVARYSFTTARLYLDESD